MEWIESLCPIKTHDIIDNFPVFDKSLALENDGFSPDFFGQLFQFEQNHFWFKSRRRLLISLLKRYVTSFDNFLEIGCGAGFVLSGLEEAFPKSTFYGSEIYLNGLQHAQNRIKRAHLFQMDALDIPFKEKFDVIGAFDVIEHIEDHEKVLCSIKQALNPDGYVFLTVPQHQWLWSQVDEQSHHKRRYARHELQRLLASLGFDIIYTTSFVFLLLPMMLLSRRQKNKQQPVDLLQEFKINSFINTFFYQIMSLEWLGTKCGLRYPCGGSRVILAQKNNQK